MPIRKFGTEPAKTETRTQDNDQETLDAVRRQAAREKERGQRDRDSDDGQTYSV